MTESPILAASPLKLVPFRSQHLSNNYVGWLNDKLIMRYSENRHRTHNIESCRQYVEGFKSSANLLWAIEACDIGNLHIGNITASIDMNNRIADIGILIGSSESSGKGYGFIAWNAVLEYLLGRDDLDKVTAGCLAGNSAMIRIMEKSGMVPDGERIGHYLAEGTRMNYDIF